MITTFLEVANDAGATLADAVDALTSPIDLSVQNSNLPAAFPFDVTIGAEILRVTSSPSAGVLRATRAVQGTTAASHVAGATIDLDVTAESISDLNDAVNALEDGTVLLDGRPGGQQIDGQVSIGGPPGVPIYGGSDGPKLTVRQEPGEQIDVLAEVHSTDTTPYLMGFYNDEIDPDTPQFAYYIDGNGDFNMYGLRVGSNFFISTWTAYALTIADDPSGEMRIGWNADHGLDLSDFGNACHLIQASRYSGGVTALVTEVVRRMAGQTTDLSQWQAEDQSPLARVNKNGDLIVENATKGVILKSPNGHYWRQTVSNAGVITTTDLGTTPP